MIDAAMLLPQILARAGEHAELNEVAAKIAWHRTAGGGLRNHAVPARLNQKTLVVSVADAVWQRQLQTMSAELIFRLNKLLRQKVVEKIEFQINPHALGHVSAQRESAPRVTTPLPATVTSAAEGIQDEELRARFMRAAKNCIGRRDSQQLHQD